jgi:ligand-binding sensor domain-containing protein
MICQAIIFCVTEDSHGFMWAGTDKGLCRFNGAV